MAKAPVTEAAKPKRFTWVCKDRTHRICQGDIFRDMEYVEQLEFVVDRIKTSVVGFPFIMVLTQDCDLEQDHRTRTMASDTNQDKHLFSVLVAPMYNYEHVKTGSHLRDLGMTMETINSKKSPFVMNNEIARYHYLEFDQNEVPIPPSVIDFKHYFSVNVEYFRRLKATNCVCRIAELHRENVCQRFASFLARIGLPDGNRNGGAAGVGKMG